MVRLSGYASGLFPATLLVESASLLRFSFEQDPGSASLGAPRLLPEMAGAEHRFLAGIRLGGASDFVMAKNFDPAWLGLVIPVDFIGSFPVVNCIV